VTNSEEQRGAAPRVDPSRPTAAGAGRPDTAANGTVIDAKDLFRGAREVSIKHNDLIYRLRITRFGKLILNK